METFKINLYGTDYEVSLVKSAYMNNDNLYIGLKGTEGEPFADLTVNISTLPENQAAVDTNNCPWAEDFIIENRLGSNTGIRLKSGYCSYPVYEFDLNKINNIAKILH